MSLQDNKNCEVLKQAIFTAKKKNLKGKYTDKSHKEIFSKLGRLYKYMTNKKFECKPEQFEVFKDSIFPYLCLDACSTFNSVHMTLQVVRESSDTLYVHV